MAYLKSGDDFNYTANIMKLADVDNPTKFVKEQFQKVFKKNVNEIYDVNENFAKKFKLPNGSFVKTKEEFVQLVSTDDFWKQLNFIKVE